MNNDWSELIITRANRLLALLVAGGEPSQSSRPDGQEFEGKDDKKQQPQQKPDLYGPPSVLCLQHEQNETRSTAKLFGVFLLNLEGVSLVRTARVQGSLAEDLPGILQVQNERIQLDQLIHKSHGGFLVEQGSGKEFVLGADLTNTETDSLSGLPIVTQACDVVAQVSNGVLLPAAQDVELDTLVDRNQERGDNGRDCANDRSKNSSANRIAHFFLGASLAESMKSFINSSITCENVADPQDFWNAVYTPLSTYKVTRFFVSSPRRRTRFNNSLASTPIPSFLQYFRMAGQGLTRRINVSVDLYVKLVHTVNVSTVGRLTPAHHSLTEFQEC